MSQQDYQQAAAAAAAAAAAGFFTPFSNGFDRSSTTHHQDSHQHYQHIAHQIRKEKLRLQGSYDAPPHPPSLVGIDDDDDNDDQSTVHHVYDSTGILSEMFNFPPPPPPPPPQTDWYSNRQTINAADSAVAMQLFLMNPNPRSPSPPPPPPPSSTLHMLLPNPSSGGSYGQFTWGVVPQQETNNDHSSSNPNEGRLSLSLSSSLEAAKAEELRMGDSNNGLLYHHHHHPHVGIGSSNPLGVVNLLRNSKYIKAAQELLEEFCSVGRGQFKKNNHNNKSNLPSNSNSHGGGGGDGAGVSSSSTKDHQPSLSATDRIEHQRRKVKLLSMLDEASNLFLYIY